MTKEMYLELKGIDGRPIQNVMWTQNEDSTKLAIFFPGFRTPTESPLFFYTKLHLLSQGWSVLALEYRLNEIDGFPELEGSEKNTHINEESKLIQTVLERELDYENYCFIGKSIGTSMMFKMLENNLSFLNKAECLFIWMTPASLNRDIVEFIVEKKIQSLYIVGDNDHFFDKDMVELIKKRITGKYLIIRGAGHMFEQGENLGKIMNNNRKVITFITENI